MCGIAGIHRLSGDPLPGLRSRLMVMNDLMKHRGPDGEGAWEHPAGHVGLGHRRLSIIDLEGGAQPMEGPDGTRVTFNGEIYNFVELRRELGEEAFRTTSDTEVVLHAYRKWGRACVDHLRGMFAFAIWDERRGELFCARDRFGIKPFYWVVVDGTLYFASEVKSLLPFLDTIEIELAGLKDYLTFQFCLEGKTLFRGVSELLPAHILCVSSGGSITTARYWEVFYELDWTHTEQYFVDELRSRLHESASIHLRSDVPVGAYLSGGFDSSVVASIASDRYGDDLLGFTGKFSSVDGFDESRYARELARAKGIELLECDIGESDFIEHIEDVVYHLDYPVAGPGSFAQYMVSKLAGGHRKVVLGGQGGDEMFGGYTRYLVAYFEQCIKAAIEGTSHDGRFIVTYESIIPGLGALRNYKPMLQAFWRDGLFEDLDRRYFALINRMPAAADVVNWDLLGSYDPYKSFEQLFRSSNVQKESYFDCMTHFDFKSLLPALLQVEDRVSMAHGLESRVPLLDHPVVELLATIPANLKLKAGELKYLFKKTMGGTVPESILAREDKMGFPVPLNDWIASGGPVRDYVFDVLGSSAARERALFDNESALGTMRDESRFGRTTWGLLSLELWQRRFLDRAHEFKAMVPRDHDTSSSDPVRIS